MNTHSDTLKLSEDSKTEPIINILKSRLGSNTELLEIIKKTAEIVTSLENKKNIPKKEIDSLDPLLESLMKKQRENDQQNEPNIRELLFTELLMAEELYLTAKRCYLFSPVVGYRKPKL